MLPKSSSAWCGWPALVLWLAGCNSTHPGSDGADARALSADADDAGVPALCAPDIAAADDTPPVLETHTISLWPPNHKFHDIAVTDCVTAVDDCDGAPHAEFIWASSDEPIDDIGDGHHAPDIAIGADCKRVSVRSERQGPKDGRVYKLGVRVVDGNGNASEAACVIIVDHDQRGVAAADSGEKYRVTFDGTSNGASCDGQPDPPVPPMPPNPPRPPMPPETPDDAPGPG